MLGNSAVVVIVIVIVVRTCPRAIPLAMITMRKSTHGFPFLSYMSMGLCRSSAIKLSLKFCYEKQECISLEHRNIETIITLPNSRTLQLAKHLKLRHLLTYLTASWLHINIRKVKATNFKRAL